MRLHLDDPLLSMLVLAGTVHALIIWGIDFRSPPPPPTSRALDVTLAIAPAHKAPEHAERLAATHQEASGLEGDASRPPPAARPQATTVAERFAAQRNPQAGPRALLTTLSAEAPAAVSRPNTGPRFETRVEDPVLRAEIARLSAEIARQEAAYLKHPRTRYLHTLSAKAADEAEYVRRWVARVEAIGNLHYPDEARRRHLSGTLIVHVLIDQDGRLLEARIGVRSGHQVLDDAALRIVRLAAPFDPFPEGMRKRYSRLMITRTWEFKSGERLRMR